MQPPPGTTRVAVATEQIETAALTRHDLLAVEEPLEIRLRCLSDGDWKTQSVAVTMRTPGCDADLAAGFLYTEGIVRTASEISAVQAGARPNIVCVELRPEVRVDVTRLERHFYMNSSCGVCGKATLEALEQCPRHAPPRATPLVAPEIVHRLPDALRSAQTVFAHTGGLHAAALFDSHGKLLLLREDVGRHNAVDKVIGSELQAGRIPLHECILLVSGRVSFELVQKALMAGIPVLAAVGAPSSLAVETAKEFDMTLLGFVRDGRFNVYAGAWRLGPRYV